MNRRGRFRWRAAAACSSLFLLRRPAKPFNISAIIFLHAIVHPSAAMIVGEEEVERFLPLSLSEAGSSDVVDARFSFSILALSSTFVHPSPSFFSSTLLSCLGQLQVM
jgi:hypothetical protein